MIADGWKMFEEAVEEGTPGDLPALLRQLKGKTTPPPPTPVDLTHDAPAVLPSPSPSPAKKFKTEEGKAQDQPVMVIISGNRSWACPKCNTVRGSKMAVTPWYVPSAAFPPIIWTHCRGTKRNTNKHILFLYYMHFIKFHLLIYSVLFYLV